ncbi:hypothetical protein GCM10009784_26700 [Arthrobacter parietis]|uniref:Uncharacterized protein n=1 Tax=Arthrobacter parietis TaxID=271434 RepID=A0ABN3B0B4_9MICC
MVKPSEISTISGVEVQTVRMGSGCYNEISESASRLSSFTDDCGNNQSVTAGGGAVEGDRFEPRFNLLQPCLPISRFARCRSKMGTSSELSRCDRGNCYLIR